MEGHEGSWVHDTHAYPLLPQHGYALLAGFLMMYNGRGVSPLKSVPPTSSSGCTPYFPFGFVPPTSPSGLYPLLLLRVMLLEYWRSSPVWNAWIYGLDNDISLSAFGYSQNGGISREAAYAIRCGLKHNDTNACVPDINNIYHYVCM